MGMCNVPQPLLRVTQGDKKDVPQLLGLWAWACILGLHGGVQGGKTDVHAVNKRGYSHWFSSGSLWAEQEGRATVRWGHGSTWWSTNQGWPGS